jgi:hypothetical protein
MFSKLLYYIAFKKKFKTLFKLLFAHSENVLDPLIKHPQHTIAPTTAILAWILFTLFKPASSVAPQIPLWVGGCWD